MSSTPTRWVSFEEIREKVSLADVLFRYYCIENLKKFGDRLVGPCPVHGGDSPRAFHADLAKNVWHCFSQCKRGGNQLDLVVAKEGVSVREAALRLQEHFLGSDAGKPPPRPTPARQPAPHPAPASTSSIPVRTYPLQPTPASRPDTRAGPAASTQTPPATTSPMVSVPERPQAAPSAASPTPTADQKQDESDLHQQHGNPPLEVRLILSHDHPHLLEARGLARETIETFGVGYCAKGIMAGTIAIPIHDERGNLVAYAGRRLRPQHIREYGKYKFPKGFRKELVLYNLNRAKEHADSRGLILVEGFFTVMKLYEAGFPNTVASMGCEVSEHQLALLAQAKDVTVLFDGDEAGWSGAVSVRDRLAARVPVRVIRLPEGADPETLSVRTLRWLLNGIRELDLAEVSFTFRQPPTSP